MIFDSLAIGSYQTNCYIFGNEQTKEVAVIDAGENIEELIEYIKEKEYKVQEILITHGHFDHTDGIAELKDSTGANVYICEQDANMLKNTECIGEFIKDGDIIEIGGMDLQVIHTPGHTQGGVCFFYENILFAGDTLFNQSIGRTDLPGGNYRQLIQSIENKLLTLPDEVNVYPGHGTSTTIGKERKSNPFLS